MNKAAKEAQPSKLQLMNKIMIAPIAPIPSRRVVISVAMRRSKEGEKKRKDEQNDTEEDEKRHVCIYLTNEKRSGMRERRNKNERDRKREVEGETYEISLMTILHSRFWIMISFERYN